jgi:hypothetical protein
MNFLLMRVPATDMLPEKLTVPWGIVGIGTAR